MKKILIIAVALGLISGATLADTTYDWLHGSDLGSGWDGYAVYLYTSSSSTLPGQINADLSTDSGFSYTGVSDTIADAGKLGYVYVDGSFVVSGGGDVAPDDYVLSVVFDASGPIVAGSTQWTYLSSVIGGTPFQAADTTNPEQYVTTGSDNGWLTVVPEPGSIALFAIGLLTLAAGSRRFLKS
jgi:hypothetical protein